MPTKNKDTFIPPRITPSRDARYMALAWVYAGFSKDPNTQIGAQIVTSDNEPLGGGYNGPPKAIDDESFSWCRPDYSEQLCKLDVVIHAEINAIDHSNKEKLAGSILYVTAFPCKRCMLEIVRAGIAKVVYMEYKADARSSLSHQGDRGIAREIAALGGVQLQQFKGDVSWLLDWTDKMKQMGVFELGSSSTI